MSPVESLDAITRLVGIASDYPSLAVNINGVVMGLLAPTAKAHALTTNGYTATNGHTGTNGHAASLAVGLRRPRFDFEVSPNTIPEKEWYTVYEIADLVGRNHQTVSNWCKRGQVRAEKVERAGIANGSKSWRISAKELARFRAVGLRGINVGRN